MLWSQYKLATIRRTEFLRKEITGIMNIANRNSNFLTLQTLKFQKKIQPESLELKTELEFCLRWGSQKLEPKIGIPNQASGLFSLTHLWTQPVIFLLRYQTFVVTFEKPAVNFFLWVQLVFLFLRRSLYGTTSFYKFSGTKWLAGWIGYWTHTQPHSCLSTSHSWMPVPPAPLASTHCRLGRYVSVWCDLPSVASTSPIFKCCEIETFVAAWGHCNWHMHKLIKADRIDRQSTMNQLLDVRDVS